VAVGWGPVYGWDRHLRQVSFAALLYPLRQLPGRLPRLGRLIEEREEVEGEEGGMGGEAEEEETVGRQGQ